MEILINNKWIKFTNLIDNKKYNILNENKQDFCFIQAKNIQENNIIECFDISFIKEKNKNVWIKSLCNQSKIVITEM